MLSMNLAVVHQQMPAEHGVMVAWRDNTATVKNNNGWGFVRVGASRAHPTLGSVSDLPAIGELGLVATIDDEVSIWVCSVHWQGKNPLVPGTSFWHTDAGACLQTNQDGEMQLDLPSGIQIRNTANDTPWPLPAGSSNASVGMADCFPLTIAHPSGLSIQISPAGDVVISDAATISASSAGTVGVTAYGAVTIQTLPMTQDPNDALDTDAADLLVPAVPAIVPNVDITINSNGNLNLTATGNVNLNASGNVALQGGGANFVMAPFLQNWANAHTHPIAIPGSSAVTLAPTQDATATAAWQSKTLQGLHG